MNVSSADKHVIATRKILGLIPQPDECKHFTEKGYCDMFDDDDLGDYDDYDDAVLP